MRRASDVQRKLGTLADVHDGLRKFIAQYDAHAELLTPAFALSGTLPSAAAAGYESMAPEELDAFLADMEPDVRAADRDMREIEALEAKGVTGAGKLADYKALEPRLEALITAHEEDVELAASLEQRIAALVDRHSTHVDALSELFVAWDDLLTDTEDKVTRLERNRQERQRLGYE
ncbi:hypothetical protein CONPUDRAFT_167124 [Coniophora puteana RWD-64-598 SS2]|uniref:Uncharacterized protein n=1 Tax=Coniophora puteana (strain RWD-64-598) TaxID=741705 RepID=A0A5M3MK23_CONPW|nr:uncharacterized protein CONPUDRAFT_167124 [Coniophora puteana RWD-64-598 SS2]EIW79367.1 hypothetical protein CONPUDRAFT_167124 [Coniophora puteana RWD-64-598 SS2]